MLDGYTTYVQAFAEVFAPRPPMTVSQWADRHRVLSGKAASEPGPWRTERTPYLREIMEALSTDSDVDEVVLWAGTQLGKSETCNNWIGYSIDYNPGPILLVQPTLDLAKRYSKQRIASLIDSTPVLRGKVQPARSRDSGNTLLEKEFDGGILVIAGANSASGLRSMPARDLLFDEIDAYPLSIDDEGDPISIAEKRQDTFARRKRLKTSTCTIKGESRIEQSYEGSDKRRYYVPCPDCGAHQVLRWANLKWSPDDPTTCATRASTAAC
jgi:phage terminase large subunit GpA-like protein